MGSASMGSTLESLLEETGELKDVQSALKKSNLRLNYNVYKYVIKLPKCRQLPKGNIFGAVRSANYDRYLNIKGRFSKPSKNIWLFDKKAEAVNYGSDIYHWGSLQDYVIVKQVKVDLNIEEIK